MQCDYFDAGVCRSCTLMGVPYAEQIAEKEKRVQELLSAWPELLWHPSFESKESGFRNKAKLVIGGSAAQPTLGILGAGGSGVDLRECGLYEPALAETFPILAKFIGRAQLTPFDVASGRGELKNIIATIAPDGALMIRFVLRSTESLVRIRKHLPWLRTELPQIAVATANLLPERKAIPEGSEEIILTERDALTMDLGDVTLFLRPQSFFQTNTAVARGLYTQARRWVDSLVDDGEARPARIRSHHQGSPSRLAPPAGDVLRLWDLYCGVGGFALHSAGPGREILGVEISEQAIDSARAAAHRLMRSERARIPSSSRRAAVSTSDGSPADGTSVGPIRFLAGDADTAARAEKGTPDIVVVNPPRRGIGELAEWIETSGARHLIYSSCNPVTLAQDLAAMPGFVPREARVFDMFPQTRHTETMVLASRP